MLLSSVKMHHIIIIILNNKKYIIAKLCIFFICIFQTFALVSLFSNLFVVWKPEKKRTSFGVWFGGSSSSFNLKKDWLNFVFFLWLSWQCLWHFIIVNFFVCLFPENNQKSRIFFVCLPPLLSMEFAFTFRCWCRCFLFC